MPIFILLLLLALPITVSAQTQSVDMRTGVHAEYSRLVVVWPQKTDFDIKKNGTKLTVTFAKNASPKTGGVDISKTRNISTLDIVKNDPLTIALTIPAESRHRSFYAGNRFVLDVYNSKGSKPEPIAQNAPAAIPKPPVKSEPKTAVKTPEQTVSLDEAVKQAKAAKVEPVETQTLTQELAQTPDIIVEEQLPKVESPGLTAANLIALSSSESIGLAVFERADKIWIVNDKPNLVISPKITGPDAQYLTPLETKKQSRATIFTAPSLIGSLLRTQGGGLLWKVIVSNAPNKDKPKEPKRIGSADGQLRGGTLFWPFDEPGELIEIEDPITGRMMKVVTSKTSKDFTGVAREFAEFEILPSAAGLVVLPRVDDLDVEIKSDGIEISRPNGLALLAQNRIEKNEVIKKSKEDNNAILKKKIFDLKSWQLGGIEAANKNQNILLSNARELPDSERDAAFMTLAKMYLANAMGAESLGFLYMVEQNNPGIANTPEFRAIRGAASALDYKTKEAFTDMSIKDLEQFEEIGFWKAYALADIGDWQQAIEVMPNTATALYEYPQLLLNRIAPVAAEVALRGGNTALANDILALLVEDFDSLNEQQAAALRYLQGEAARQTGQIENTKELWEPLVTGKDDLYRTKAGLALSRLLIDQGELTPANAIDTLERLRYAWRGDELEARVGYWLGRTYFEAREFVKGLNIMRESATVAAGTNLGTRITNEMTDIFTQLYMGDTLDTVSPLDAVALYEQFSELLPSGKEGDKIVERLADRLTAADLLGRASNLLSYQLNHRLEGIEAYNVAVKLAAIRLLDSNPQEAIKALDIAQEKFETLPEDTQTADKIQDMTLLRARALSREGRPDQGIAMLENLNNNPTTNRLRADIAWTAGYWDDAAVALGDVIIDKNISLTRPLSDENTTLILHRAISLNLAADRIGLANMREKYSDSMAQTDKARIFEVITRPRQSAALADRETLLGIVSEVDLFSDFLESYKSVTAPSN